MSFKVFNLIAFDMVRAAKAVHIYRQNFCFGGSQARRQCFAINIVKLAEAERNFYGILLKNRIEWKSIEKFSRNILQYVGRIVDS